MEFALIFFMILGKVSLTMVHMDEKVRQEFCPKTSILKMKLQEKTMALAI
jgi:hypothetical protein